MKLQTVKYLGIGAFFLLSTGIIVPWLLSNDQLPVPFIILGVFCSVLVWLALLEKPFFKMCKWIGKLFNEYR